MVSRFDLNKKFLGKPDKYWKRVIYSDESTYELFPTKKHETIYRRNGKAFESKNLVPSVKFGRGKVMGWNACFTNDWVTLFLLKVG